MLYPVTIYQKEGQFIAHAPDLPTLSFVGENMADVIRNARLTIIEHLQALAEQGKPLPKGNDLSVHLDNPEFFGQTWAIISLDSLRFSQAMVAYQLALPEKILNDIHRTLGDNASLDDVQAFILTAIQDKLAK